MKNYCDKDGKCTAKKNERSSCQFHEKTLGVHYCLFFDFWCGECDCTAANKNAKAAIAAANRESETKCQQ
jgi:hypothetical protein